jgi:hypothetical protein
VIRREMNFRNRFALLALSSLLLLFLVPLSPAQAVVSPSPGWQLLGSTGPTNLPPLNSEVQKVAVDATGGTFTLTFETKETSALAFNASASEVASALNALDSVGGAGGSVEVSGGPGNVGAGNPYYVRFGGGSLAGTNVLQMTANSSLLTGSGASATVSPKVQGGTEGAGTIVVAATNVGGAPSSQKLTARVGPLTGTGISFTGSPSGNGWGNCTETSGKMVCSSTAPVAAGQDAELLLVPVKIGAGASAAPVIPMEIEEESGSAASYELHVTVSHKQAGPGVQSIWAGAFDPAGQAATAAGGHPTTAATGFRVNTMLSPTGEVVPSGDLRDFKVDLPTGFIGNPTITVHCPQNEPAPRGQTEPKPSERGTLCSADAKVGTAGVNISLAFGLGDNSQDVSVYNDDPPSGYPAQFGFIVNEAIIRLVGSLRSESDFGVTVNAPNLPQFINAYGSYTTLKGVPTMSGGRAFISNPSDCAEQARITPVVNIEENSWQMPNLFNAHGIEQPVIQDCAALGEKFKPQFSFQPSTDRAAFVTSGTADLKVDQTDLLDPSKLAPPHLKKSVVELPEGFTLNPSAADGLEACTTAQMGLLTTNGELPNPIRFNEDSVSCPDGSKIGTAEITTPLLGKNVGGNITLEPLHGTVYLAAQEDNPFHSLLAMYIVVDDAKTGTVVKLPGEVTPDPQTGQLTAMFDYNPQVPFSDLKLQFRGGGPRSTLATPDLCAAYSTQSAFTPWSAPESGPPATGSNPFTISKSATGSSVCPQTKAERPFDLGFEAGSTDPVAGGHSPFTLRVTRPDGNQELSKVNVTTPPGFAATLKGVAICPEDAVKAAQAAGRTGAQELANPSCPASSQVGTTAIGAGVGSQPFYVKTGKVYLTGPYKGAPVSLAFIVPAVAGPFDLGVQVVRTALRVNPVTTQVTAESDEIPQILKGIPLLIRDVRVDLDRPNFTLNPTNCEEMGISGQVTGGSGGVANLKTRFQVNGCKNLKFNPGLKIQLHGGTKRADYQSLEATVSYPEGPGYANIARASVALPHSEFLAQENIKSVCTRVQFAAHQCPPDSIYGTAEATSPLLDGKLTGSVYLRSSSHKLPDLVVALRGPDAQPIEVELAGRTDSIHGGIRNTFEVVPDAPVSSFQLKLFGGKKKSLIYNSRDICKGPKQKATVKFTAQNGLTKNFRPVIRNDCKKKGKASKSGKRRIVGHGFATDAARYW